MKDQWSNLMKKTLFGLLITFLAGASVAAQAIEQKAATQKSATEKTEVTQTSQTSPNANTLVECGCEDKRFSEILGVVNGVKITRQDLSAETQSRVEQLQREVIKARQRELDLQIDSILLEVGAKKRNVSPTQLLKDEVVAKVQAPTEAEALAFYEQNKTQIKREFKDAKGDIVGYLRYQ